LSLILRSNCDTSPPPGFDHPAIGWMSVPGFFTEFVPSLGARVALPGQAE